MLIDIGVCLFGLFMLWRGYVTGAFAQVIRVLAVLAGYVVARLWAAALAPAVGRALSVGAPLDELTAAVLLWLAVVLMLSVLLRWLFKPAVDRHLAVGNKLAGALVGLVKAALLAYIVLALLAVAAGPLSRVADSLAAPLRGSYLVSLVARHNILARWTVPAMAKLEQLAALARHPKPSLSADTRALLADPHFAALVQDPLVGHALVTGDWGFAMQDPRVLRIFQEPQLLQKLLAASLGMQGLERGGPPQ